jgi:hypothetical protein
VVKCSDVSEQHTASIFRVTEMVQVDAEVTHKKKHVGYVGWFEGVWAITATNGGEPTGLHLSQYESIFMKMPLFRASTSSICKHSDQRYSLCT